ncbi:LexA family transcriptional regulator [Nitrosovibrio sp. Nv17]|uniref:LexA family protein n=1 Tax=Nitrosovibrio sp. Nv17 TaxID=1855339 RepID=UPI0009088C76|nr:LexA family transcriptional regulator [Nitrosovibrio sp. Nv17]SFW25780.1 repressor LexA [Nitrosovibrio sp. Nv17]
MSRDLHYLKQLQDYYARHKALPSFSAIAAMLGFGSKNSVAALASRLQSLGYLERTPDHRLKPGRRFFERTLADSSVQAGAPTAALEEKTDVLTIDDFLIDRPSQTVLVRVKGDSMKDAGILAGDIVVVEKRSTANPGEIVVAMVGAEFTLKTLGREDGRYTLIPANAAYPVLRPTENFEIFGVVVGQFRKYG